MLDAKWNAKDAQARKAYEKKLAEYNSTVLPNYEKAKGDWVRKQSKRISELRSEIDRLDASISRLYTESLLIPKAYRSISVLEHVYEVISTSNMDVACAIEDFKYHEERKRDEAMIQARIQLGQLQQERNQILDEQTEVLQEQAEIARKARRDANIGEVIRTVQHHNTNKMLKDMKNGK